MTASSADARAVERRMAAEGKAVMDAMASLGHPIRAAVEYRFEPTLRIMGYSRPVRGGYRVVAGPGALQDNLLVTLLAHELGHVQRMSSGHPSHSNAALAAAYAGLRLAGPQEAYHEEILHDVLNNVQDLYADGIAFDVMRHLKAVPPGGIGAFFLAWMKVAPETASDPRESRWQAAHAMVGNARALAQIKTQGTPEQTREAQRINTRLLKAIPNDLAAAQPWFQSFYDTLPNDATEAAFAHRLAEYLRRFVVSAEALPEPGATP